MSGAVILIIEDNPEMADYLRDVVQSAGYIGHVVNNGAQGLQIARTVQPTVVLLDLWLPDIDGRTICQRIKQDVPDSKIIMITAQDTPEEVARGLDMGADDYLPKPVSAEELLARIRARLRDSSTNDHELVVGDLRLNTDTHQVWYEEREIALTAQEFRLLEYFMMNPNRVLSRDMILSRIWQGVTDVETRVVDVYVGYLRKKIDTKKQGLFTAVRGFGYMLKIDADAHSPVA